MLLSQFCKMDKRSGDWLHNSVNVLMNAEPYTSWLNFVLFINFLKMLLHLHICWFLFPDDYKNGKTDTKQIHSNLG